MCDCVSCEAFALLSSFGECYQFGHFRHYSPSLCPHPAPLLMMRQSIEAAYLSPECDSCHFKLDQSTKTWQTLLEKEG